MEANKKSIANKLVAFMFVWLLLFSTIASLIQTPKVYATGGNLGGGEQGGGAGGGGWHYMFQGYRVYMASGDPQSGLKPLGDGSQASESSPTQEGFTIDVWINGIPDRVAEYGKMAKAIGRSTYVRKMSYSSTGLEIPPLPIVVSGNTFSAQGELLENFYSSQGQYGHRKIIQLANDYCLISKAAAGFNTEERRKKAEDRSTELRKELIATGQTLVVCVEPLFCITVPGTTTKLAGTASEIFELVQVKYKWAYRNRYNDPEGDFGGGTGPGTTGLVTNWYMLRGMKTIDFDTLLQIRKPDHSDSSYLPRYPVTAYPLYGGTAILNAVRNPNIGWALGIFDYEKLSNTPEPPPGPDPGEPYIYPKGSTEPGQPAGVTLVRVYEDQNGNQVHTQVDRDMPNVIDIGDEGTWKLEEWFISLSTPISPGVLDDKLEWVNVPINRKANMAKNHGDEPGMVFAPDNGYVYVHLVRDEPENNTYGPPPYPTGPPGPAPNPDKPIPPYMTPTQIIKVYDERDPEGVTATSVVFKKAGTARAVNIQNEFSGNKYRLVSWKTTTTATEPAKGENDSYWDNISGITGIKEGSSARSIYMQDTPAVKENVLYLHLVKTDELVDDGLLIMQSQITRRITDDVEGLGSVGFRYGWKTPTLAGTSTYYHAVPAVMGPKCGSCEGIEGVHTTTGCTGEFTREYEKVPAVPARGGNAFVMTKPNWWLKVGVSTSGDPMATTYSFLGKWYETRTGKDEHKISGAAVLDAKRDGPLDMPEWRSVIYRWNDKVTISSFDTRHDPRNLSELMPVSNVPAGRIAITTSETEPSSLTEIKLAITRGESDLKVQSGIDGEFSPAGKVVTVNFYGGESPGLVGLVNVQHFYGGVKSEARNRAITGLGMGFAGGPGAISSLPPMITYSSANPIASNRWVEFYPMHLMRYDTLTKVDQKVRVMAENPSKMILNDYIEASWVGGSAGSPNMLFDSAQATQHAKANKSWGRGTPEWLNKKINNEYPALPGGVVYVLSNEGTYGGGTVYITGYETYVKAGSPVTRALKGGGGVDYLKGDFERAFGNLVTEASTNLSKLQIVMAKAEGAGTEDAMTGSDIALGSLDKKYKLSYDNADRGGVSFGLVYAGGGTLSKEYKFSIDIENGDILMDNETIMRGEYSTMDRCTSDVAKIIDDRTGVVRNLIASSNRYLGSDSEAPWVTALMRGHWYHEEIDTIIVKVYTAKIGVSLGDGVSGVRTAALDPKQQYKRESQSEIFKDAYICLFHTSGSNYLGTIGDAAVSLSGEASERLLVSNSFYLTNVSVQDLS